MILSFMRYKDSIIFFKYKTICVFFYFFFIVGPIDHVFRQSVQ